MWGLGGLRNKRKTGDLPEWRQNSLFGGKLKGIELSRQSTRREKLTRDSVTGVCIGLVLLKFPAEYQLAHMCEETVGARVKRTP